MLVLRWTRAYSKQRRYQMTTINISDSLNLVLKNDRNLQVTSLLDAIRQLLQQWFYERSKAAFAIKRRLTSWVENVLCLEHEKLRSLLVIFVATCPRRRGAADVLKRASFKIK